MRAAVAKNFGQPLELTEVPRPEPAAGQILIKVHACGVCHTDLHAVDGDWPDKASLPFIPGHEVVGEVVKLGDGVKNCHIGDRVGVPWLHRACGRCEHCLAGWETLCEEQIHTGYDVDGGWAEYMVADPAYVALLPSGLDWVHAAPLICAGVTVYKGLRMTDADPGDWVAVSGIGGLGHLAVQYARAMGFRVVAIDIDESKLDLASELGASLTVNAREVDPAAFIQRQLGGVHGALVTAVGRAAFSQAVAMVRAGGTVVLNGLPPGDFPVDIYGIVMRAITLRGSIVGTRHDLARALEMANNQHILPRVHTAPLEDVQQVIDRLRNQPVVGRYVLTM